MFVQNPSIVLASIALVFRPWFGYTLIVDAHNSGVAPLEGRSCFFQFWANAVHSRADFTIITNTGLASHISEVGGSPLVIPDPVPHLSANSPPITTVNAPQVVECFFISTWSADEPFQEVISASLILGDRFKIVASGRYQKVAEQLAVTTIPSNFTMTGYLTETEFVSLLLRCDIVIDLTTREDCLVCGAYEAVAAEKPMILSDTACLKAYFSKGVVFTQNDAVSIANAIIHAAENIDSLQIDIRSLKDELSRHWPSYMNIAIDSIGL